MSRARNIANADTTHAPLASPVLVTPNLGTPSAGVMTNMTGAVEASLVDNAVTLAKMAGGTDGNLITYDTSGNPAYVATGTSGHVLTSAGADAVPAFAAAVGAGVTIWQSIPFLATTFSSLALVGLDDDAEDSDLFAMPLSHNDHFTVNADGSVTIGTEGVYLILINLNMTGNTVSRENYFYVTSTTDDSLPGSGDTQVLYGTWVDSHAESGVNYYSVQAHGLVKIANNSTRFALYARSVNGTVTVSVSTTVSKSNMTLIRISA